MAAQAQMEKAVSRAVSFILLLLLASPASAALRVLVVSGLGGEPEYETRFVEQANAVARAAGKAAGAMSNVTLLTGAASRREAIEHELQSLAKTLTASDQVLIVVIGHGTYDGEEYRLNLPGRDITGAELARLFDRLPANQQLIVNATSASGAVAERWKRANRIVITATKSGGERNATRFAEFWVQALESAEADRDKDQVISANEAFEFASRKVADAYKADAALATEHARIEGPSSARFLVARLGDAALSTNDAELNAMLGESARIDREIEELKARKPSLAADAWYDELEKVMIELAQLDRNIDRRRALLNESGSGTESPTGPGKSIPREPNATERR
jgi:hypothetical protein